MEPDHRTLTREEAVARILCGHSWRSNEAPWFYPLTCLGRKGHHGKHFDDGREFTRGDIEGVKWTTDYSSTQWYGEFNWGER